MGVFRSPQIQGGGREVLGMIRGKYSRGVLTHRVSCLETGLLRMRGTAALPTFHPPLGITPVL